MMSGMCQTQRQPIISSIIFVSEDDLFILDNFAFIVHLHETITLLFILFPFFFVFGTMVDTI